MGLGDQWVIPGLARDWKLCSLDNLVNKPSSWLSCGGRSRWGKDTHAVQIPGTEGDLDLQWSDPSSLQDLGQYPYYLFLGFISSLR